MFSLPLLLLSALAPLSLAHAPLTHLVLSSRSQCQPFETTFAPGVVSASPGTPFLALSPPDSYSTDAHNLQLYLTKPSGTVTTTDGVNNVVGEGATVNSTFTFLHGRITYTLAAPVVPGVVTAAIFIADEGDEVDVELLGGDPSHWQTNVYAPSPSDNGPLWGVFGEIEGFSSGTIKQSREYTVDWNAERIMWSVDGQAVRTVTKDETMKNGALHFPTNPTRISLGIWDASSPAGTAAWAKGPIDWSTAPSPITATFSKISLECPY